MSSSLNYPGGKGGAGVYQTIINQIPPHEVYVEPFAGGAAVFRHKRLASRTELWEISHSQYLSLRQDDATRKFVHHGCGLQMLERYVDSTDNQKLFYCDPPYPLGTRTARKLYGEHEWDDAKHQRFLSLVLLMGGKRIDQVDCPRFLISTYPNDLYARLLNGWRRIEFEAITRGATMRTEWLFMNYAAPTELHDYRYYGRDKRHREKIRRAGRSMAGKLKARAARDPLAARAILSYVPEELR